MSREHVHRNSSASIRRSSLANVVLESTSSKIFPLDTEIDFDIDTSRRASLEHHYRDIIGPRSSDHLTGRSGISSTAQLKNHDAKVKVHPKR